MKGQSSIQHVNNITTVLKKAFFHINLLLSKIRKKDDANFCALSKKNIDICIKNVPSKLNLISVR
jgi:hypothetical protein